MIITKLEIIKMLDCEHVILEFPDAQRQRNNLVYILESPKKCDAVSNAIQLICSRHYATVSSLHALRHKLMEGKVILTFLVPSSPLQVGVSNNLNSEEDSDEPCTSSQARERARRRQSRRRQMKQIDQITATRDFQNNEAIIEYTVNRGPTKSCSVLKFQTKFFSCADSMLPYLTHLKQEKFFNGKWFNLLRNDCEDRGNDLLQEFGRMFVYRKVQLNEIVAGLTTASLLASSSVNVSKISTILKIFRDTRRIFEYITCSEYTVWFLMPSDSGSSTDIAEIAQNIDFEQMRTMVQLRVSGADAMPQIPWTQAENHIKELLVIALQLAFAYYCHEPITFLHSVKNLQRHQNLIVLKGTLAQNQSQTGKNWFSKHYLQRIVDVCLKVGISAVIEYEDNLPLPVQNAAVIQCHWESTKATWRISVKKQTSLSYDTLGRFLKVINLLSK